MERKLLWLGLAAAGIFVLGGCATVNKKDDLANQALRNRVSALEAQLNEKDNEINSLKEAMAKPEPVAGNVGNIGETRHIDARMIQAALKNAGYFQGEVDGKMGTKTRQAVREFQKANKLHADGRVGKNTWALLKEYVDKKVK